MKHGGDLLSYKDRYEGDLVDFSSNINPLGPPQGLYKLLTDGLKTLTAYPDIKYRKLKKSIGKYLNCQVENILLGNGAVEIIDNFIMEAPRVLILRPSFLEYEERTRIHKKDIRFIGYREDFTIDIGLLGDIREGELLILGNPNNPTGLRIGQDDLVEIYRLVRKAGGFLLLDEAFYEFCPKDYNSIELFKEYGYEGVAIIRAATKFFGLPGIRLGYACCSPGKASQISKIQVPWRVNALADIGGSYIFDQKAYIEESKAYIEGERQFLLRELANIGGIRPYMSQTNYILIKLLAWEEDYVFDFFLERGLLLRKCSSFRGLDKDHIRIAIKDRESNLRLLRAFKELEGLN